MSFELRRVIARHDEHGNSIVKRDEIIKSEDRHPGYQAMTVWCTREFPVNNNDDAFKDGGPCLKAQQALLRISETQPDQHSKAIMHRTEILDYAVILSGECELELENEEKIEGLKAGDVVIQCGTNHGWAKRRNGLVRYLFVLIGAEQVKIGKNALGDELGNFGGQISPMPSTVG